MQFKQVMMEGFESKIKSSKIKPDDKTGLLNWYKDMQTQLKAGNTKGAKETKANIIKKAQDAGVNHKEAMALFN